MLLLLLSLGCTPEGPSRLDDGGTDGGRDGGSDDGGTDGGTSTPDEPLARTDVVVIGAGGSGLAAGVAAREAGANVMVLEREAEYGGGARFAMGYFAVATPHQEAAGIADSVELALEEWPEFTGGDTSSPAVEDFLRESAEILAWLESKGAVFHAGTIAPVDTGSLPRVHSFDEGAVAPVDALAGDLEGAIVPNITVTGLVMDEGRVTGVHVEQLDGATGWIAAEAVVVATGGFGRNDERVAVARPGVDAWPTWYEAHPGMDGNGLDLVEAVGGALSHLDGLTLFSHSVPDPQVGGNEAMAVNGLCYTAIVDASGQRFATEADAGSASWGAGYLERGPFYALIDDSRFALLAFTGRGFNYIDSGMSEEIDGATYEALAPFPSADDLTNLAAAIDLDPEALAATVARYNEQAAAGMDTDFGKSGDCLQPVTDPPLRAIQLVMARAKSFGGASMGTSGEVLDARGEAIPGLFAAGEAGGFLGGPWVGHGFNGSINAAMWSGRRAGRSAAAVARD